ncbi:MAG: bifunctional diaminohydroxyphosphoribosylaminopyrimidine deaminase/5-amino-6-(5-phosphoribosylamino)uracil reductase RibD [Alphaproteobacteria bacterium]
MHHSTDMQYMRYALSLARRGLGRTPPNPSVGCVIVKNDRVVGIGRTADGGRPHAETVTLEMAGEKAKGASAYITLEPCAHHGQTPPCAQALIDAGLTRCVIACEDSAPHVAGQGIAMLKKAGIEVISGVREQEAKELNAGFFLSNEEGRPFVTLKTALSLDGKIALGNGQSQWITNALARAKAHQLRSRHDAILCGIGTVNMDDPMLNTRVDGLVHKSVRIILDTRLSIDMNSKLVQSALNEPVWIMHDTDDQGKIDALENAAVKLFRCKTRDLFQVLQVISENGVTRLLVEGGAEIHTSFLREGLFDELAIFTGNRILGAGLSAFRDLGYEQVNEALQLKPYESIKLGQNRLDIYKRSV